MPSFIASLWWYVIGLRVRRYFKKLMNSAGEGMLNSSCWNSLKCVFVDSVLVDWKGWSLAWIRFTLWEFNHACKFAVCDLNIFYFACHFILRALCSFPNRKDGGEDRWIKFEHILFIFFIYFKSSKKENSIYFKTQTIELSNNL